MGTLSYRAPSPSAWLLVSVSAFGLYCSDGGFRQRTCKEAGRAHSGVRVAGTCRVLGRPGAFPVISRCPLSSSSLIGFTFVSSSCGWAVCCTFTVSFRILVVSEKQWFPFMLSRQISTPQCCLLIFRCGFVCGLSWSAGKTVEAFCHVLSYTLLRI